MFEPEDIELTRAPDGRGRPKSRLRLDIEALPPGKFLRVSGVDREKVYATVASVAKATGRPISVVRSGLDPVVVHLADTDFLK